MITNAYDYVLANAERLGGSDKRSRCKQAMDIQITRFKTHDALTIVETLEADARYYHELASMVPTDAWTKEEWRFLNQSNACSFAAMYIRKWYGDYFHNAPVMTSPFSDIDLTA